VPIATEAAKGLPDSTKVVTGQHRRDPGVLPQRGKTQDPTVVSQSHQSTGRLRDDPRLPTTLTDDRNGRPGEERRIEHPQEVIKE